MTLSCKGENIEQLMIYDYVQDIGERRNSRFIISQGGIEGGEIRHTLN